MTIREYFKEIVKLLSPSVGSEAEATARIIFEDVAGYSRTFIFADGDRDITDFTRDKIAAVAKKVSDGEPVQYAVGKARFMGLDFKVTPAVLIPRPETEGLIDLITDDYGNKSDLTVLDACTGSGCIAIALARALPFATVDAFDISDDALAIARENAKSLGANVAFTHADALALKAPAQPLYDIIVSNPPYVCDSEKADMDKRVLDYEPATALFVADSEPLRFYTPIAAYAASALRPGGRLYFEINPLHADALKQMLADAGFENIEILRDYRGLNRFARAQRPAAS